MRALKQVASGWGNGSNTANVYLYPNEPRDVEACDVGGYVSDAIDRGFSQLTSSAIEQYYVYLLTPLEWPSFDRDETPYALLGEVFVDWLDENSDYWPAQPGCHMLVAREYHNSGGPHETDYNRVVDVNSIEGCGFTEAQAMLLGLRYSEEFRGKQRNFAVQEPLHTFIPEDHIADRTDLLDPNSPDEHQLGTVRNEGDATPMLTGHAGSDDWYYDESGRGECGSNNRWTGGHSLSLTRCTRAAVGQAAVDSLQEESDDSRRTDR